MLEIRNAYVLSVDINSSRALHTKKLLQQIGFNVFPIPCIKALSNSEYDKVISNKRSMMYIYQLIVDSGDQWSYVFEDDINTLDPTLTLSEIIKYEKISTMTFYLGLCRYSSDETLKMGHFLHIENPVYTISGNCRGLHAIGLSHNGARKLLKFAKGTKNETEIYMDIILEKFCKKYPANIVRYDLESYITGHRGVIFQDRNKFPSGYL